MSRKVVYFTSTALLLLSVTGCGNRNLGSLPADDLEIQIPEKVGEAASNYYSAQEPSLATATAVTAAINTQTTSMQYDTSKHYSAILKTTAGEIQIELNYGQTPNTVKNFVDLARKGFYNKTIFHRVIKGFMIQGGDPKGDGTGGPGYRFDDEPFTGEYTRGTIAMANAGPNTNGSQFFIMHADYPLPKNYVIFGKVVKGIDAVDIIANTKVTYSEMGEMSKPLVPTVVTSVEIVEE